MRVERRWKDQEKLKRVNWIRPPEIPSTPRTPRMARRPWRKQRRRAQAVTSNDGKLKEFRKRLEPLGYTVEQRNIGYPEPQVPTMEEVVEFGLEQLMERVGHPVVIDDSGIFVHHLKGFPGVYSAYAFKTVHYTGILKLLEDVEDRSAHFETVIGFGEKDGGGKHFHHIFKGEVHGTITHEPRDGGFGFGYDPIFIPDGHEKTFAEMEPDEKNSLSHRGRALDKFVEFLKERDS